MSDLSSEDYSHENSYEYESNFESNNAAYIVRTTNFQSDSNQDDEEEKRTRSVKLVRNFTPNATLSDFNEILFDNTDSRENFITTTCTKCKCFVGLPDLSDHVDFHKALSALNFKEQPKSIDELIRRRRLLVKAANISNISHAATAEEIKLRDWELKVKRINVAYEIVKSHMDGSFEETRKLRRSLIMDAQVESVLPANPAIISIGKSAYQNKKHRKMMEDTNTVIEAFGNNLHKTYIGLFDGYDGHVASSACASQLHLALLKHISKFDKTINSVNDDDSTQDEINNLERFAVASENGRVSNEIDDKSMSFNEIHYADEFSSYLNNLRLAFNYSFKQMDKLLSRGRNERAKTRWSGATCFTCLIESVENKRNWIHLANLGDVEALLIMDYREESKSARKKYKVLTTPHVLSKNQKERERVETSNCRIIESEMDVPRIEGLYEVTRAFGFHGDMNVKRFMSHKPTFRSVELDENCACIVVASKGFWKVLTYDTVAELVSELLPSRCVVTPVTPDQNVRDLINKLRDTDVTNEQAHVVGDRPAGRHSRSTIHEDFESDADGKLFDTIFDTERVGTAKKSEFDDEDSIRPRTLPDEYMNQDLRTNENYRSSSKANSDIYPLANLNKGSSQHQQQSDELRFAAADRELSIEECTKLLLSTINNNNSNLSTISGSGFFKLKNCVDEMIQVNKYDIDKELRKLMQSALRYKLDLTDQITRRLMTSALLAGSVDNITINCIMLPGSRI